jgi:molybdopterin converting factor small subunit
MTFLEWISIGQAVAQLVSHLIKQHEGKGNGEQKRAVVVKQTVALVGESARAMGTELSDTDELRVLDMAEECVDVQVEFLNETGEFTHTAPAAPKEIQPVAIPYPSIDKRTYTKP